MNGVGPITLDFTDVGIEFDLDRPTINSMIDFVIKEITTRVAYNWELLAKRELHKTRSIYLRSIVVGDSGPNTGFIKLVGVLPNMIEEGCSPFDMKLGFSKSSKAKDKKGKSGWYLTIPFRWATPMALGESEVFSGKLPEEVYKIAKTKSQGESLKVGELPQQFRVPKTREMVISKSKVFEAYVNKTPLLAGLTRIQHPSFTRVYSRYMTFRRVSDLSDPDAFIHSGIVARKLGDRAYGMTDIPFEVEKGTDKFLYNLGF